jgi:hypothetical protein
MTAAYSSWYIPEDNNLFRTIYDSGFTVGSLLQVPSYLKVADWSGDGSSQQPDESDAKHHTASGSRRSVPARVAYDR